MKEHLVPCGPAVNKSEPKAFEPLKSRLISESDNDEWLSLTNLAFSATHHHRSDGIGIVAVGPPGDRVVEQEANRVTNKARKTGTMHRKRVRTLAQADSVFRSPGRLPGRRSSKAASPSAAFRSTLPRLGAKR